MKITKQELQNIILEETNFVLKSTWWCRQTSD